MATQDKTLISSSQYDIYAKLLTIASKYTNIESEDFLKTGLFGYITESMAMIARDSSFHKTMLYNESFLNTASMPKSVYNWAKMFNINIANAIPAYADIMITLPIEEIENPSYMFKQTNPKYGPEVVNSDKNMLILDRSNPLIAAELQFMMERSVAIYRSSDISSSFIVKYISTEEPTTAFQRLDTLFLRSNISRTDGKEYLSFIVRAFQYTRTEITKQISSASFLDTKIHNFDFNDQFIAARLYYKKGTSAREEIDLRYSNIPSTNIIDSLSKFAYYNLSSSNSLQIKFSSAPSDFIPAANSTLYLDLYTTKGASGNIEHTGDVFFRLQEEEMRNIPIYAMFFNSFSLGGIDRPSLNRIKNMVINEISTRDVIVTENDLNNYFLILTALLETINDGKIKFIKKRDDILRRVFSSYILMRDGLRNGKTAPSGYLSKALPTNTLDALFDVSTNVSKPFGSIIERRPDNIVEYHNVEVSTDAEDYYIIPFYTRITLSPFKKVKYIYNLTDMSTNLAYRSVTNNSGGKYFIPSTVSVYRGMEGMETSNHYSFKFSFITNFNLREQMVTTDSFGLSFYRKGTETVPIRTMEFSSFIIESDEDEENAGIFETTIELKVNVGPEEFNFDTNKETDYGTNIIVLDPDDNTVALPSEVKVVLRFNNITNDSINMDFISGGFLTLFKNLDELMYSDVSINETEPQWNQISTFSSGVADPSGGTSEFSHYVNTVDGGLWTSDGTDWTKDTNASPLIEYAVDPTSPGITDGVYYWNSEDNKLFQYDANTYVSSVKIKSIPLVHSSFFNGEESKTKFINQLFVYIDMLKENLGKLETNTFFDLKFYNTHGLAQYYNTLTTHIKLELDVHLKENVYDEGLENTIKDYVRLLVDQANENKSLRISDLIRTLTNQFYNHIDHVDFKGLNDTFSQYISQTRTLKPNLYAPEYLNIPEGNLKFIRVIDYDGRIYE
jgi:hypothetical protein